MVKGDSVCSTPYVMGTPLVWTGSIMDPKRGPGWVIKTLPRRDDLVPPKEGGVGKYLLNVVFGPNIVP
jgi:hypothetical protein